MSFMKKPGRDDSLPDKEQSNRFLIPPSSKPQKTEEQKHYRQNHNPLDNSLEANGFQNRRDHALDYNAIMDGDDNDDNDDRISDNARRSLSHRRSIDPTISWPISLGDFPRFKKTYLSYLIIGLLACSTIVQTVRLSGVGDRMGKDTSFSPDYASGNLRGISEGDTLGSSNVTKAEEEGRGQNVSSPTAAGTPQDQAGYASNGMLKNEDDGYTMQQNPPTQPISGTPANAMMMPMSGLQSNSMGQQYPHGTSNTMQRGELQMSPQQAQAYTYTNTNAAMGAGYQVPGASGSTPGFNPNAAMGYPQQYPQEQQQQQQQQQQGMLASGSPMGTTQMQYQPGASAMNPMMTQPSISGQGIGSVSGSNPNAPMVQFPQQQQEQQQEQQQQQQQQQQQGMLAPGSTMGATQMQYQPGASEMNPMMTQPSPIGQSQPILFQPGLIPSFELLELSNFKDTWDAKAPTDLPVLLKLGTDDLVEHLMTSCNRMIMASGGGKGHATDPALAMINVPSKDGHHNDRFINIDTTTTTGIQRAVQLGFATSGLGNAIVSPFLFETNLLLQPNTLLMGRFFGLFYHPVERAVRVFEQLKETDLEVEFMDLQGYAASTRIENNLLTRTLSNQPTGELTEEHMKVALEIIRRKFLVGLGRFMNASLIRFEQYYHWSFKVNPLYQEQCRNQIIKKDTLVDMPAEGTTNWNLIMLQNQFDMQLYGYIESLFSEQEQFVSDVSKDVRNEEATCCECVPPTLPVGSGYECPLPVHL